MTRQDDHHRISADAARKILDRAAELDTEKDGTFRVAELRSAAVEAGISEESFDRAMRLGEETRGNRWQRASKWVAFLLLIIATAALFLTLFVSRPAQSPAPSVVVPEQTP